MSALATAWAWQMRPGSQSQKLVLLALADRHNKDTGLVYPSVTKIAADTELHRRTVMQNLKLLEEAGLIIDSGRRAGRTKQVKVWMLALGESAPPKPGKPDDNLDGGLDDDPEETADDTTSESPADAKGCRNVHPKQCRNVHSLRPVKGAGFSPKGCRNVHTEPKRLTYTPLPPSPSHRDTSEAAPTRPTPNVDLALNGEGYEAWQFRSMVHTGLQKRYGKEQGNGIYNNLFAPSDVHFVGGDIVIGCPNPILRDCISKPEYASILKQAAKMAATDAAIIVKVEPKKREATRKPWMPSQPTAQPREGAPRKALQGGKAAKAVASRKPFAGPTAGSAVYATSQAMEARHAAQ